MESIVQKNKECFVCGNPTVEKHHLIGGTANRKLSDKDGLWIWLCRKHHEEAHLDSSANLVYKRLGQIFYETDHTRDEFIKRYGKSFIDKDLEKLGGIRR